MTLPRSIEEALDQIGVRATPRPDQVRTPRTAPALPEPWKPKHPGDEPPF